MGRGWAESHRQPQGLSSRSQAAPAGHARLAPIHVFRSALVLMRLSDTPSTGTSSSRPIQRWTGLRRNSWCAPLTVHMCAACLYGLMCVCVTIGARLAVSIRSCLSRVTDKGLKNEHYRCDPVAVRRLGQGWARNAPTYTHCGPLITALCGGAET